MPRPSCERGRPPVRRVVQRTTRLGGAAIALGLAGINATVYEASEDSADGIGAMLTVAPNGIAALSSIGLTLPDGLGQTLTRTVMADSKGPTGRL